MHKSETSDFLNEVFSGTGQMSAKQTLSTVLPSEAVLLNMDVNLEKKLSWKFIDQKRSSILNELARQLNFSWRKIDHRILITKIDNGSTPSTTGKAKDLPDQDINTGLLLNIVDSSISTHKFNAKDTVVKEGSQQSKDRFEELQNGVSSGKTQEHKSILIAQNTWDLASIANSLIPSRVNTVVASPKIEVSLEPENFKPKAPGRFEITQEDETLSSAFKRWSTQEGYQLVWDAEKDFPAIQTSYAMNTIEQAILHVMKDIENTEYPLHACIYKNKVLRIVPMTKVCERQKANVNE